MTGNEYPKMRVWSHHRWQLPLPAHHSFPLAKYECSPSAWSRTALSRPATCSSPSPSTGRTWRRYTTAGCSPGSARAASPRARRAGLGSLVRELVERGRRSVGGTIEAAFAAVETGVAINLGGGRTMQGVTSPAGTACSTTSRWRSHCCGARTRHVRP